MASFTSADACRLKMWSKVLKAYQDIDIKIFDISIAF